MTTSRPWGTRAQALTAIVVGLGLSYCRTPASLNGNASSTASALPSSPPATGLAIYEQTRIQSVTATKDCRAFAPQVGMAVSTRDAQGHALTGTVRVLSDNARNDIWLIGDFNQWGQTKTEDDHLHTVSGTPYFEGKVRQLTHGMQYRFLVNGVQLLDPAAPEFTAAPDFLNSVFWDFGGPTAYHATAPVVDLRHKPILIGESEVYQLAQKWRVGSQTGPAAQTGTYKFVADSGLVNELKQAGYNAVEFLPFNTSRDGDFWHYRYQVYGLYAPDARYGTPDDFARMIDTFNKAGIAVVMDAVVGHYPFQANDGARQLGPIGLHQWRKADGKALYGDVPSPWGTNRYDYANPYIRRFLSDSVMHMMCRYGIAGVRFDNLDGIRLYEGPGGGGPEFIKEMATEIRAYRPEAVLIGEMFFGFSPVLQGLGQGEGFGIGFRTHSDLFDYFKDNMQKSTQEVDMQRLRSMIRGPWDWQEAPRVQYITNHDEASNKRDGATGAYVASLLAGGDWYYVEKKTMVFASIAMLSGAAYMDMPQMRLLQQGSFTDNPAVDWSLKDHPSQQHVYGYFAALSRLVRDDAAFAFTNYGPNIENHIDTDDGRRIISFTRRDAATGKLMVAVLNLSHVGLSNYAFGIDTPGSYQVMLDNDANVFGGTGELEKRLPGGQITADGPALHGKSGSLSLPFLPPYGVVVLAHQ